MDEKKLNNSQPVYHHDEPQLEKVQSSKKAGVNGGKML